MYFWNYNTLKCQARIFQLKIGGNCDILGNINALYSAHSSCQCMMWLGLTCQFLQRSGVWSYSCDCDYTNSNGLGYLYVFFCLVILKSFLEQYFA